MVVETINDGWDHNGGWDLAVSGMISYNKGIKNCTGKLSLLIQTEYIEVVTEGG